MSTWRPIRKESALQKWVPWWIYRILKLGFFAGIAGLFSLLCVSIFYAFSASKYDLTEVTRLPSENLFFDSSGEILPVTGLNSRMMLKREQIPDFLIMALLAREDAKFYQHRGIDVKGLARAMVRNIKDRKFTQGASTLSMQLTRNTYGMRAKSLHRKALEIALTLRIESHYTKDEIVTSYLNRVYFGSGAYGLAQAARVYFGKEAVALKPEECAMLVGIIRGPHIFSPLRDFSAAKEQQNQTLARMVVTRALDSQEKMELFEKEILLTEESEQEASGSYAGRVVTREFQNLAEKYQLGGGGLKIFTTINSGWQKKLEDGLEKVVVSFEKGAKYPHPTLSAHTAGEEVLYLQYAAVTLETKTGAVMAYIGSRDLRHSGYDRTRSKRDLGGAFEPFIAAAAAERGKLVFPGRPIQTGRQLGISETIRLAKRCGLTGRFSETEDLFRGTVAATPLEVARGLATLENSGRRPEQFFIKRIENAKGKVLYKFKRSLTPALSEDAGAEAKRVFTQKGQVYSFSGATGSERDAWIFRFGPTGSTVIWLGFDQPKKIASERELKNLLKQCINQLGG